MERSFGSIQAQDAMKRLREALHRRKSRITDGAFLTELEFGPVEDGKFEAVAKWESGGSTVEKGPGQYTKVFNTGNSLVAGRRYTTRYRQTFCCFADDLVKEILRARGVVK